MSARQAKREAKQLLRLCLVDGAIDETRARQVVRGVLRSKRRGYLVLLKLFHRLVQFEYARHTAQVESAFPLPADIRSRVQASLEVAYGPGMALSFDSNPGLIGGMRIQVGCDVYDGSIRSRLAALATTFGIASTNGKHAMT